MVARYAGHSVAGFERQANVGRFLEALEPRCAKFGLSPNAEKTRVLEFSRFAAQPSAKLTTELLHKPGLGDTTRRRVRNADPSRSGPASCGTPKRWKSAISRLRLKPQALAVTAARSVPVRVVCVGHMRMDVPRRCMTVGVAVRPLDHRIMWVFMVPVVVAMGMLVLLGVMVVLVPV